LPLRAKLGLSAEILAVYIRVRLAMRRTELPRVVEGIRAEAGRRPSDPIDPRALGAAVMGLLALLPTDSRCLVRSLVYLTLISRRGVAGTLVIGARTEPEFAAHAWVEVAGDPMLPSGDGEFQPLTVL
jgi:hypothetical protein